MSVQEDLAVRVLRHLLPEVWILGARVDLTEGQKAFLAVASGVPAKTIVEDGKLVVRTEPSALVWNGYRWEIFYQARKQ